MNKKQRNVILIGIIVFTLMGLFPPWYYSSEKPRDLGYYFITNPPPLYPPPLKKKKPSKINEFDKYLAERDAPVAGEYDKYLRTHEEFEEIQSRQEEKERRHDKSGVIVGKIDKLRLYVQWIIVVVATGGLAFFLKDSESHKSEKERNDQA